MHAAPRRSLSLMLGAALLSAAACADATAPNGTLSADETNELALQMGVFVADGFSASAVTSAGPGGGSGLNARAVPAPISIEIGVNVPCPRGGHTRVTATLSGTIDRATESIVADISGT